MSKFIQQATGEIWEYEGQKHPNHGMFWVQHPEAEDGAISPYINSFGLTQDSAEWFSTRKEAEAAYLRWLCRKTATEIAIHYGTDFESVLPFLQVLDDRFAGEDDTRALFR